MATDLSSIKQAQFIFGGRNSISTAGTGPDSIGAVAAVEVAGRPGSSGGHAGGGHGGGHGGGGHPRWPTEADTVAVATEADTVAAVTGAGTDIADV